MLKIDEKTSFTGNFLIRLKDASYFLGHPEYCIALYTMCDIV